MGIGLGDAMSPIRAAGCLSRWILLDPTVQNGDPREHGFGQSDKRDSVCPYFLCFHTFCERFFGKFIKNQVYIIYPIN